MPTLAFYHTVRLFPLIPRYLDAKLLPGVPWPGAVMQARLQPVIHDIERRWNDIKAEVVRGAGAGSGPQASVSPQGFVARKTEQ